MAGNRVTPKEIWDELERAGASAVQAAGLMGNAISESALNPEAINPGGPSAGVGLWQWQTTDYPGVPIPTGNAHYDLKQQVNFLASTGGIRAASGTTVSETAGNFAANYERCAECFPGGPQYNARIAQASQVAGWAAAGDWPTSGGHATDTATLTASQAAEQNKGHQQCAWEIGWGGIPGTSWLNWLGIGGGSGNVGSGEVCLISKSQLRHLIGVGLLLAGAVTMFAGVSWIVKAAVSAELAEKLAPVLGALGPEGAAAGAAVSASAPRREPARLGNERQARINRRAAQQTPEPVGELA